ncbi:MAG: Lrp/AsnC family transcriptional regulator [Candidatus Woesearchaeota archaeon]
MNRETLTLNSLRKDSRKSFAEIASETGLPTAAINRTHSKLIVSGKIRKNTALFDNRLLGLFQSNIIIAKPKQQSFISAIYDFKEINNAFKLSSSLFEIHTLHSSRHAFADFLGRFSEYFEIIRHIEIIEPLKEEGFVLC